MTDVAARGMLDVVAYRFVEHLGEVEIDLEATDELGIFESALDAFAELVGPDADGEPARHEIELGCSDHTLLLADWLSELVFLAEVEHFVPERVTDCMLARSRLRATVAGRRGLPRHLVKAVTLNGLALERKRGMWHGHVVLDV
jgi:SHS2 domain-containing protein